VSRDEKQTRNEKYWFFFSPIRLEATITSPNQYDFSEPQIRGDGKRDAAVEEEINH